MTALCKLICVLLMTQTPGSPGASPDDRGVRIMQEYKRRSSGYGDSSARLKMVLRDRRGRTGERRLSIEMLEVPGDGPKSLAVFDYPPDIKGTALLTHAHRDRDDDQWLYLPATRRVRRITASGRSGSFVGSEFSYEDIASREIERYSYRLLREEPLAALDCYVVESTAADASQSGYRRMVWWIDKDAYRVWKIDYYDLKDALLKTLVLKDYQQHEDRFWRPASMEMTNHQTGRGTTLEWSDHAFGAGLDEADFSLNRLQRIQ